MYYYTTTSHNSNTNTFKFYSATTEPQQKASAGDNNFSDDSYLSDEFEGDSATISTFFMSPSPFDAGEDDEDEKTEQNVDRFLSIIIIYKILITCPLNVWYLREH